MASIITATTTSGLTQSADNSGVLQLASGTGNLVTVPSVTGTAMVSGNMPAFAAYPSSGQTSVSGLVKILFGSEEYDTNNCFASSRFTPNVAGYYQLNAFVSGSWVAQEVAIYVYKNGSNYKNGLDVLIPTGGLNYGVGVNTLVYANGTTDYFEIYLYSGLSQTLPSASTGVYFNGSMVRGA